METKTEEIRARFWRKVRKGESCWTWTACITETGYGRFGAGKLWQAHRYSWTIEYGPIPAGHCVLHRCGNRLCVRPEHLFVGTKIENARDRASRGLYRSLRGEQHGAAKLTDRAVREIHSNYRRGMGGEFARRYNVSADLITSIARRKHWRHVE